MAGGTTIVDRLNKLSGKDATTIAKALENLEEGGGIGGFEIHICASGEYDAETKVPTIEEPDSSTLYLVPTSSKSKNMFDEYVWTGTDWEKFGTGSVALPSPTTADNGKVLKVVKGEYQLRNELPVATWQNEGNVVSVYGSGTYVLKEASDILQLERIILNGAYAYKYGKLAIVSYTPAGIFFPAMVNGSGGLYVVSGSMEVDYDKIGSNGVLGYGYDAPDKTKRYAVAVTASTASGKDTFFLVDVDTMASVSTNKTFFGMFFIPCK